MAEGLKWGEFGSIDFERLTERNYLGGSWVLTGGTGALDGNQIVVPNRHHPNYLGTVKGERITFNLWR